MWKFLAIWLASPNNCEIIVFRVRVPLQGKDSIHQKLSEALETVDTVAIVKMRSCLMTKAIDTLTCAGSLSERGPELLHQTKAAREREVHLWWYSLPTLGHELSYKGRCLGSHTDLIPSFMDHGMTS